MTFVRVTIGTFAVSLALLAGLAEMGLRYNGTPSVPTGFYWLEENTDADVSLSSYVAFCPPPTQLFVEARRRGYLARGTCPAGTVALLKVVAAVTGDVVRIDAMGVHINGKLWPESRLLPFDRLGRTLPVKFGERRLEEGELLLMSERFVDGFDGRYFGPVLRTDLLGRAYRIWS